MDELILFSAVFKPFCRALVQGFEAAHPQIRVTVVDGISTDLNARLGQALLGHGVVPDVVWSSAMDQQIEWVMADEAAELETELAGTWPQWARFKNRAFATTLEPVVNLATQSHWRTSMQATDAAELAATLADWSSGSPCRIGVFDVRRNGLGCLLMAHALRTQAGFEALIKAWQSHELVQFKSNPEMIEALAGSSVHLSLGVLGAFAMRALAQHPALFMVSGQARAPGISRIGFVPRRARNLKAGFAFLDFMLSPAGQACLGRDMLFPLDAPAPFFRGQAVPMAALEMEKDIMPLLASGMRERLIQEWATYTHAP